MPGRDIVVVGASAGGVEALGTLVSGLPEDLPAAIFVVLHVPDNGTSVLPSILNRRGPLPASHAVDGQEIRHGQIYVAPPDSHLVIKRGHLRLTRGPKENGHRPAVDPLFRTAARSYGRRVAGVVLSGTLDDGTAGLAAIKERGGLAIAQSPDTALYPGMPLSAIENVQVDYILPVSEIAPLLAQLADEPVDERGDAAMSDEMEMEADIVELEPHSLYSEKRPGVPSRFTCPDCNGVLWEIDDEGLLRFRCRVGHAYSSESLLAEQFDAVESALWAALRALEENISLASRVAARMRNRGHQRTAERFERQVVEGERQAEVLRRVLMNRSPSDPAEPDASADRLEAQEGAEAKPSGKSQ
ncbi:MAG TPA: chemotaxis protein CheB [Blastocatellia bacterium]|nr:chemotaxis protein CheB [Blastocatellia bacterium]